MSRTVVAIGEYVVGLAVVFGDPPDSGYCGTFRQGSVDWAIPALKPCVSVRSAAKTPNNHYETPLRYLDDVFVDGFFAEVSAVLEFSGLFTGEVANRIDFSNQGTIPRLRDLEEQGFSSQNQVAAL